MRRYDIHRAYLRNRLKDHPCAKCGGVSELWHHVDPSTKRKDVAGMSGYRRELVDEELAKCVALCRSCHMKMHEINRFGRPDPLLVEH
jgi:hypothetical protein